MSADEGKRGLSGAVLVLSEDVDLPLERNFAESPDSITDVNATLDKVIDLTSAIFGVHLERFSVAKKAALTTFEEQDVVAALDVDAAFNSDRAFVADEVFVPFLDYIVRQRELLQEFYGSKFAGELGTSVRHCTELLINRDMSAGDFFKEFLKAFNNFSKKIANRGRLIKMVKTHGVVNADLDNGYRFVLQVFEAADEALKHFGGEGSPIMQKAFKNPDDREKIAKALRGLVKAFIENHHFDYKKYLLIRDQADGIHNLVGQMIVKKANRNLGDDENAKMVDVFTNFMDALDEYEGYWSADESRQEMSNELANSLANLLAADGDEHSLFVATKEEVSNGVRDLVALFSVNREGVDSEDYSSVYDRIALSSHYLNYFCERLTQIPGLNEHFDRDYLVQITLAVTQIQGHITKLLGVLQGLRYAPKRLVKIREQLAQVGDDEKLKWIKHEDGILQELAGYDEYLNHLGERHDEIKLWLQAVDGSLNSVDMLYKQMLQIGFLPVPKKTKKPGAAQ